MRGDGLSARERARRPPSLGRAVVERLGLVVGGLVAGVGLLVVAELALRALGIQPPAAQSDPFAGFSRVVPMFAPAVRADGMKVYRVSAARTIAATGHDSQEPQREFLPDKAPGTFRVFVIGDSSAAGVPYGTGYAFSTWLGRRLAAELPGVPSEVVNAAMPGYATRRLTVLVDEIAGYAPDLVIVYNGHNEFAERRFYAHLLDTDPRLFRLRERLVSTRLWGLLAGLLPRGRTRTDGGTPRFQIEEGHEAREMFAVLNERAGGHGYPTARERAYGEMLYRRNLEYIVRTARAAGARVMLLTLSQNFAGWPPGASAHRSGLSADDLATWTRLVEDGTRAADEAHDCPAALAAWGRALAIDDAFADLQYRMARCEERLGDFDAARARYRVASDLDQVPHGAPTHFNDVIREVARAEGALLADADGALVRGSAHGLVGNDLFADWVHPNIGAHQLIAAAIADELRRAGVPAPAERWTRDAYADPDPGALLAADPGLRVREHFALMGACLLAHREVCALGEADTLIASDPSNVGWRKAREEVLRQAAGWRS